jgi:hypothetical protein
MDLSYRVSPFLSRLRGRVGWRNDLAHGAARSWIIDPGRPSQRREALHDPADLEHICGVVHDWHSIQDEIDKIRGGPGQHAPAIAYELHGAVLSRGALFTPKLVYPLGAPTLPLLARRALRRIPQAVLASTGFGLKWFGHWLFDDLPLLLAAEEIGEPFSALTRPSAHQRDYLGMVGATPDSGDEVYFDKVIVLQDFAQNDHKRRRHAEIRRRVLRAAPPDPAAARRVMLLRGDSGQRRGLTNEPAIADALRASGFAILDPMREPAAALVAACANAEVLVGVEGSQLAHGILAMRRGGTVITLQPPSRFSSIWNSICDGVDVHYGFVVGRLEGAGTDFRICIDGLRRLIDRVPSASH